MEGDTEKQVEESVKGEREKGGIMSRLPNRYDCETG
jgi:hypothetical protein